MDQLSSSVATWGYGLAALAYSAFAVQLGLGLRQRRGALLLAAVLAGALWGGISLAFALQSDVSLWVAASVTDTMRLAGWLALLASLLRPGLFDTGAGSGRGAWVSFALAAVGVVALHAIAALGVGPIEAAPRIPLYLSLGVGILGLVLVEQLYRNLPEHSRWGLKPLCFGLGGLFAFEVFVYAEAVLFRSLDADMWAARGFVGALVIPFLAVSAARNRDWRIDVHVSRQVVFRSTALIAVGGYLLTLAVAGYFVRSFGGSWGRALQAAILFAGLLGLLALATSGTLRSRLRVFVSKHFFSYRYDYREEWLRFTQALGRHDPTVSIRELSIRALADLVESPGAALWLAAGEAFEQVARWNLAERAQPEPAGGSLAAFLRDSGWVVSIDQFRADPDKYPGLRLPEWLLATEQAWLVVPLQVGGDLIGFVVLAKPRATIELNWEVNDLLKTAGRQAATFLGQVQAAEALLEARKFESFSRLSAFVVHDIKNLVAQLSLMLRNAERHKDNPEFQQDMLDTVANVAERLNRLLLQLRAGVTPIDAPHPVDLEAVVARIARAKKNDSPSPEMVCESGLQAMGHVERLERVIGHLVQNAIDATGPGGRVWLRARHEGSQALVEVGDTGHGMTKEFVRDRLFKPFQTTKSSGMGIGAFESQQYVKELGGAIEVDSEPNVGTTVTVRLPLARPLSPSPRREAV
jgi:putative PEP-CTERM system histidine kinase